MLSRASSVAPTGISTARCACVASASSVNSCAFTALTTVSAALRAVLSADVAVRRASRRGFCAAPGVGRPRRVAAARLAAALRCAGVRLRWLVERRLAVERVPVELVRVLLRRVLLVLVLRRVVPRLFWVAIVGDPSSASDKPDVAVVAYP